METLPFYVFLFVHLISLVIGFGSVIIIDTFGLLWMIKKVPITLVHKVAGVTQILIWLGWIGLVISGIGLITIKGYIDNLTIIKLFFVAMIGFNGIFLHFIKRSTESVGELLSSNHRFRIFLASAVSQLGWWGAVLIGFLHRHWQHNISWPSNPSLYIGLIILAIVLTAGVGEFFTRGSKYIPRD